MPPSRALLALILVVTGAGAALAANPAPVPVNPGVTTQPDESATTRPLLQVTAAELPSADLLKTTLAALTDARSKLKLLHLTGRFTYEEFDAAAARWNDTGSIEGEVFAELAPPARVRLDITLEHTRWTNGPRPFFDEAYVEVFDGKETHHWQHVGKGRPDEGHVNSSRALSAENLLGTDFTAPFMTVGVSTNGVPVTHNLAAAITSATASARRVTLNDTQPAIELTFTHNHAGDTLHETWYLDPDHACALLAARRTVPTMSASSDIFVHALLQAAPGIYYPQHATRLVAIPAQHLLRRTTFTAAAITANEDPPPDLFTLEFPPGMNVVHEPPPK